MTGSPRKRPAGAATPRPKPVTPAFDDLLAAARPAERSIPVCLRGDLVAEIDELERQLGETQSAQGSLRLVGNTDARKIAGQIEALRAEMAAASVPFRLRALPRRRFTGLIAAHPPRPDQDRDKQLGVDESAFFPELLRVSIVDPVMSVEQFDRLVDEVLTDAQYDSLATAAWNLNRRDVDVPFSFAASAALRISALELQPPEPSASA